MGDAVTFAAGLDELERLHGALSRIATDVDAATGREPAAADTGVIGHHGLAVALDEFRTRTAAARRSLMLELDHCAGCVRTAAEEYGAADRAVTEAASSAGSVGPAGSGSERSAR